MKKIFLLCGLLTSSLSFGAGWSYVATSSDDTRTYINRDTFKYNPDSNSVTIWVKKDNFKTLLSNGYAVEVKQLDNYLCSSNTVSNLSGAAYDVNGNVLESSNEISGFKNVIPDSVGETVFNYVCKNPKYGLEPQLHEFDTLEDYGKALKQFSGIDPTKIDEKKFGKSPDLMDYTSVDDYVEALGKYQKRITDDVKRKKH